MIPPALTKAQTVTVYASEADLLNVALFGMTAAQWRHANPGQPGNMRDAATLEQLVVLSNLESINAVLIHQRLPASERLAQLNGIAITQMRLLIGIVSSGSAWSTYRTVRFASALCIVRRGGGRWSRSHNRC
ncbi:MAG: hypothetical protein FWD79_08800 [Desulfobulbus sp.]|nr:hypothetical protein [Desulfobulbus sp.]